MYRVELKVRWWVFYSYPYYFVPNVPCGVERRDKGEPHQFHQSFLMYRVELKAKGLGCIFFTSLFAVPNVPCGVESNNYEACLFLSIEVPNVPCGVERGTL